MVNDDIEEGDDWWDPSKPYTGWDYKNHFGEDVLKKLYQAREARHRIILLGYLSCAFLIYLSKQKMDYLSHFLDLMH